MCVGGRAGGRGFSGRVRLSGGLLALLQLGHPGHRPLTVHVLELLDLENTKTTRSVNTTLLIIAAFFRIPATKVLSQDKVKAAVLCYLLADERHDADTGEDVLP